MCVSTEYVHAGGAYIEEAKEDTGCPLLSFSCLVHLNRSLAETRAKLKANEPQQSLCPHPAMEG